MGDQLKAGVKTETPKNGGDLRDSDVIAYLRRNPRLLLQNPDLLAAIAPDTRFETDTVVVDMQRFVVERLRRQVDDMKVASDRLVTTTRTNMSLIERTMECALALLYARDFSELTQILHDDLPVHLGVDAVACCFESDTPPVEAGQTVRSLPGQGAYGLSGFHRRGVAFETTGHRVDAQVHRQVIVQDLREFGEVARIEQRQCAFHGAFDQRHIGAGGGDQAVAGDFHVIHLAAQAFDDKALHVDHDRIGLEPGIRRDSREQIRVLEQQARIAAQVCDHVAVAQVTAVLRRLGLHAGFQLVAHGRLPRKVSGRFLDHGRLENRLPGLGPVIHESF